MARSGESTRCGSLEPSGAADDVGLETTGDGVAVVASGAGAGLTTAVSTAEAGAGAADGAGLAVTTGAAVAATGAGAAALAVLVGGSSSKVYSRTSRPVDQVISRITSTNGSCTGRSLVRRK